MYIVKGNVHAHQDLLRLRPKFTQDKLETVNTEKIIVIPDEVATDNLRCNDELPITKEKLLLKI